MFSDCAWDEANVSPRSDNISSAWVHAGNGIRSAYLYERPLGRLKTKMVHIIGWDLIVDIV
jgi:hypothetical protein